ncbi:MAG: Uma2 family endonuclease [Burkholderiales bacterium]|nr:Uma2 family endonuclease [Burkholderiales bacterium]
MADTTEIIEAPLSYDALGAMYRKMCNDPLFANVPGKIELDRWGRMVMSPASNYHGTLQARLVKRLADLGGEVIVEASVLTPLGLLVPDVVWASAEFIGAHRNETPFEAAPELCIEVTSPSNSRRELTEKVEALLAAGAIEVWIVYSRAQRIEAFGRGGALASSRFALDVAGLFD